jgi:hypothetical protein
VRDEFRDRPFLGGEGRIDVFRAFRLAFGFHKSVPPEIARR